MVAVRITQYLTNTANDPRRSQVGLERVGRFVAPIVLSLICLGCAGSRLVIRSTTHTPDQPVLRSRWPQWFVNLAAPRQHQSAKLRTGFS